MGVRAGAGAGAGAFSRAAYKAPVLVHPTPIMAPIMALFMAPISTTSSPLKGLPHKMEDRQGLEGEAGGRGENRKAWDTLPTPWGTRALTTARPQARTQAHTQVRTMPQEKASRPKVLQVWVWGHKGRGTVEAIVGMLLVVGVLGATGRVMGSLALLATGAHMAATEAPALWGMAVLLGAMEQLLPAPPTAAATPATVAAAARPPCCPTASPQTG